MRDVIYHPRLNNNSPNLHKYEGDTHPEIKA